MVEIKFVCDNCNTPRTLTTEKTDGRVVVGCKRCFKRTPVMIKDGQVVEEGKQGNKGGEKKKQKAPKPKAEKKPQEEKPEKQEPKAENAPEEKKAESEKAAEEKQPEAEEKE